jgi:hypothetical protein
MSFGSMMRWISALLGRRQPQIAPAVAGIPAGTALIMSRGLLAAGKVPTATTERAILSEVLPISSPSEPPAAVRPSLARPRKPMPAWLAASTRRKAAAAGLAPKPTRQQKAAQAKPRRKKAEPAAPKVIPKRKPSARVVWHEPRRTAVVREPRQVVRLPARASAPLPMKLAA